MDAVRINGSGDIGMVIYDETCPGLMCRSNELQRCFINLFPRFVLAPVLNKGDARVQCLPQGRLRTTGQQAWIDDQTEPADIIWPGKNIAP